MLGVAVVAVCRRSAAIRGWRELSSSPCASVPTIALNDGTEHPAIGYGTYKVGVVPASASSAVAGGAESAGATAASCEQCVGAALDLGYRMLDMAEFYGNETEVGAAIAASKLPRGDLYLASKCWTTTMHAGPRAVRGQVERTLASLGTDYLDLYLLHWPVPGFHVDAYRELQRCQREGLVRSIGVSNYTIEDAEELAHADGVHVTPAINQIEVNPLLYRRNTVEYFQGRGIVVQAYRALCDGKAFDNSVVCDIGRKHGRRPAQILGRWSLQKGLVYLPKSVNPARMQENMQVFDFELDGSDVSRLDALTGAAALHGFQALYEKCVVRDTPLPLDHPSVKRTVTCD